MRAPGRLELIEMTELVLPRALEPFPIPVRTLDALHLATSEFLHLATSEFLRGQGESVALASYDNRLLAAAQALGISIAAL
jgi:hypothetical protein